MSYLRPSSEMLLVSPGDGVLGGGVGRGVGPGRVRGNRSVINDASAARLLRLHEAYGLLGAQERAGQVDGHHRAPLLVGQVLHRNARSAGARVVEQNVEASEGFSRPGEQRGHRFRLRDVGWDGEHGRVADASAMAAVRSSSAARRPASTTEYPAEFSARLTARPMPLPAPVTSGDRGSQEFPEADHHFVGIAFADTQDDGACQPDACAAALVSNVATERK